MRYDSEHKQRTRQQILVEAARAIRAKGPDRVGVAEVMAGLGLTHGGFYAHFKSKDDLIAESITHMFDEAYARFLQRTEGLPPKDALIAYLNFYVSRSHRDGRTQGCPLPSLSGDIPRLPGAARRRFAEGAERLAGAIAKLLERMGTPNPTVLASSVVAEMVGAIVLARGATDPARSDEILVSSRRALKGRLGLEVGA
jgi:TetR/AcrR family transcriptional repressor of nem operon